MARMHEWQREAHEAVRREVWSLRGPNQIVKVQAINQNPAAQLSGYITLGKFLLGKTPKQIEQHLGLPHDRLLNGARIYRFMRLPLLAECNYELTALHPGGLAYNPGYSDPRYPPGHSAIHQWEIKQGVQIPVDLTNFLELKPGQRFPYNWLLA